MSTSTAAEAQVNLSPKSFTIDAHNGMKIMADAWGNPDDKPILFAHGGGQTRHAWRANSSRMAWRCAGHIPKRLVCNSD